MTLTEFCQALLRVESTPNRERAAIELAAQEMEDLGYDEVVIDGHGNLLGRIGPEGGPVLVVDGHIDTIPLHSPDAWRHDPFGAEIDADVIYGLGASDMKGPVAAFIHGLAGLKGASSNLKGCVYAVASIAEEMTEGAAVERSFAERPIDYCIIAEATALRVATAQRGRAKVEVEIRGRGVHAANAWKGVNAVDPSADLIKAVRSLPRGHHDVLGERDINVIDIHSEPYPSVNVIPTNCLTRFDVRFIPGETRESLLEAFRKLLPDEVDADVRYFRAQWETYVGEEYDVEEYSAAWETPQDHPLVTSALTATGAERTAYQFCTNGSYFAGDRGVPTIGYGPADPASAHTVDESIPVDQLHRAATGYRDIALALLGGQA
jgi:putative selenium metabolism hydrolase